RRHAGRRRGRCDPRGRGRPVPGRRRPGRGDGPRRPVARRVPTPRPRRRRGPGGRRGRVVSGEGRGRWAGLAVRPLVVALLLGGLWLWLRGQELDSIERRTINADY